MNTLKKIGWIVFLAWMPMLMMSQTEVREPERPFQLGIQLFGGTVIDRSSMLLDVSGRWQAFSGLVFRYVPGRWGFRSAMEVDRSSFELPRFSCTDCGVITGRGTEWKARAGAQFMLSSRKKGVYAFAEVVARYYDGVSEEHGVNGFSQSDRKAIGGGLDMGLGGDLRIFRQLYLSPEGFAGLRGSNVHVRDRFTQDEGNFKVLNLHAGLRLNVLVKF